jgi:hypothetical protein
MAYETPYPLPARTGAAQRLRSRIAATPRAQVTAPKRSETRSAEGRATFAIANHAEPSSELVHKRFSSGRTARIAKEQEMAALCQRRAFLWADAIREGLDPDIARFVRDQAAAWQLLATSYARSARDASGGTAVAVGVEMSAHGELLL